MQEDPYRRSDDGRDYVCAACGEVLPDGVTVLGRWEGEKIVGVRAEGGDGTTLHACGVEVVGASMSEAERIEARNDPAYVEETGAV